MEKIYYIIPTLGVWNAFDDISFENLPEQFVLKCTHDSGGLVICTDKKQLNIDNARTKINKSLKTNYYKLFREWPYKNVTPRIVAEKFMVDNATGELRDYKFYCFDGVVRALGIYSDRGAGKTTKADYFDRDFNWLDLKWGYEHAIERPEKPSLQSTIEALKNAGIQYSGVGSNLDEARKVFYTFVNGIKIGIYCCAEHEFSIASEHKSGVNPFDPMNSLDDVKLSKEDGKADFLIVLYHGGKEHYRYPSPQLQKICHKLIEKGADLVVCQHSHCVGCKEEYKTHLCYLLVICFGIISAFVLNKFNQRLGEVIFGVKSNKTIKR